MISDAAVVGKSPRRPRLQFDGVVLTRGALSGLDLRGAVDLKDSTIMISLAETILDEVDLSGSTITTPLRGTSLKKSILVGARLPAFGWALELIDDDDCKMSEQLQRSFPVFGGTNLNKAFFGAPDQPLLIEAKPAMERIFCKCFGKLVIADICNR